MSKKKKIWISVVVFLLIAAGIAAWLLVPRQPLEEVYVYGYDMVGYVNYFENGTESYGVVATDRVQSLFVSDSQQVTELLVYQGQQVTKGDVLYRYDTTLSDLELERKDLSIQQMEINLKVYEEELKNLNAMKPMVIPEGSTQNTQTQNKIPSNAIAGEIYNTSTGSGTSYRPYYVWLKNTTTVSQEMICRYLSQKDRNMNSPVCVVFRIANWAGGEYTSEYGVVYERVKTAGSNGSVSGSQITQNQTPTTGTSSQMSGTDTSISSTVMGETQDGADSETTAPTQATTAPTEATTEPTTQPPTAPTTGPTVESTYTISMRFFDTSSSTSADDGIIWNSGYTRTELEAMRKEKTTQIEQLRYDIKMGKAELEIMKKEADSGEVRAEFDGVVTSVLEPTNAQEMNVPMIKVSGGGGFYVEGSVSELDLSSIQVGQTVTVTSWDTFMTYEGTIQEIGTYPTEEDNYFSYGAPNLSYYPYKVFIEESADLQEGYYVSMTYQTETENENGVMYLENAFLRTENGRSYVYVRGVDGLLERREVQTGDSADGYMTEILSGISETDYIAFPYGKTVVEGAPTVEGAWENLYGAY